MRDKVLIIMSVLSTLFLGLLVYNINNNALLLLFFILLIFSVSSLIFNVINK